MRFQRGYLMKYKLWPSHDALRGAGCVRFRRDQRGGRGGGRGSGLRTVEASSHKHQLLNAWGLSTVFQARCRANQGTVVNHHNDRHLVLQGTHQTPG